MSVSSDALQISPADIPNQQTYSEQPFPLVLQCTQHDLQLGDVVNWASHYRAQLVQQATQHGAILFRGLPLATPDDFDQFISAFEFVNFPYDESLSNAVRINYTPRIFSANEAPPDVVIYLHHEMAQTPIFPGKLFFFCQQPAAQGGATPLCRSDVLFERIVESCPKFANDCEQKGLRYTNVMPSANDPASGMGRSWQQTFGANDHDAAESRMRAFGYSWQWLPDGCLKATTPLLPAVREVAPGRKTFFNQLIAAFCGWKDSRNDPAKAITFGDATPLNRDAVMQVAELAEQLTFDIPWQQGDVALLDNTIVMHGRRPFIGSRKVLASLADARKNKAASDV